MSKSLGGGNGVRGIDEFTPRADGGLGGSRARQSDGQKAAHAHPERRSCCSFPCSSDITRERMGYNSGYTICKPLRGKASQRDDGYDIHVIPGNSDRSTLAPKRVTRHFRDYSMECYHPEGCFPCMLPPVPSGCLHPVVIVYTLSTRSIGNA